MANGTVTVKEFWQTWWDDEKREAIRVGEWRTAYTESSAAYAINPDTIQPMWICIKDGAKYPDPDAMFKTRQEAIDWMVELAIAEMLESAINVLKGGQE